jgi:pilus assembly protein Flp/PilA
MQTFWRFLRSEDGPTAVEYAVMLAMILLACIGAISLFGQGQGNKWQSIQTNLQANGF